MSVVNVNGGPLGFVNTARQTFLGAFTASVTLTSITAGNLLIVGFENQKFSAGGAPTISAISDTLGTTYHTCNPNPNTCSATNFGGGSNHQNTQIYWGTALTTSASDTLTVNFGNSVVTSSGIVELSQYAGYSIVAGANQQNVGTAASSGTSTSISVSTTNAIQSNSITYAIVGVQCQGTTNCSPSPKPVYTSSVGTVEDQGSDTNAWHAFSAVGDSTTNTFSGSIQVAYVWDAVIIELLLNSVTSVTCSPGGIADNGGSSICTAVVTSAGSTATGTVTWSVTSGPVGTFTPSSCTLSGGQCSSAFSSPTAGTATINGAYSGSNAPSSASTQINIDSAFVLTALAVAIFSLIGFIVWLGTRERRHWGRYR